MNAGQQQLFTRNSNIDSWTNGVWNQVFLGDNGAPDTPSAARDQPVHTLPSTPVSEEAPFLDEDARGNYQVFVPAVQHNSVGPDYGRAGGRKVDLDRQVLHRAAQHAGVGHQRCAGSWAGPDPDPGDLQPDQPIDVSRPNTVVLGLGFPTLIPQHGNVAMETANAPGIKLSGLLFDAGPQKSPALLRSAGGRALRQEQRREPDAAADIFARSAGPSRADHGRLVVNTNDTILDDLWLWRADHGNGVGWNDNTADTGLVVNGDNVNAYGLAVEHYQKAEVIWNGQNGEDVFFQNEMPYDPPSQAAWMSSPTTKGSPRSRCAPGESSRASAWGATRSSTWASTFTPRRRFRRLNSRSAVPRHLHDLPQRTGGSGGIDR